MTTNTNFHGVYPILYSFFDDHGALDREAMRRQVEACIANGAHGIAVMGLATEVGKLDVNERRMVIEWVGEDINGRVPYAVTVGEGSVSGQIAFVKAAQAVGADWAILQPPAITGVPEAAYVRFLGDVADKAEIPLAVQNAGADGNEPLQRRAERTQPPTSECLLAQRRRSRHLSQRVDGRHQRRVRHLRRHGGDSVSRFAARRLRRHDPGSRPL
ncbi:MAG: dihydrodipicolinate synthase family protein [Caldilineaceae bacterium]